MPRKSFTVVGLAAVCALFLVGCAGTSGGDEPIGGGVIAPVTMSVNELHGAEVELLVGQVLNINTDSLAVDSYTGEVSDPAVIEFTAGHTTGSAEFNPGVTALAEGTSDVTMTNDQGGIQPLQFTVNVIAN